MPKGPTPKRTYLGKMTYQDLRKLDATPNRISPDFPSEKDLLRQKDLVKCFGTDVGPFGVVICSTSSTLVLLVVVVVVKGREEEGETVSHSLARSQVLLLPQNGRRTDSLCAQFELHLCWPFVRTASPHFRLVHSNFLL